MRISQKHGVTLALLALVGVTVALRIADFPGRFEVRDMDEKPYVQAGLQLLEGMTPSYKFAPAGPQTWLGWGYAGTRAARYFVAPTPEEKRVPIQVRPFVAVNHALFDEYGDQSGLRLANLIAADVLCVLAVTAGFAVGYRLAGLPGAVFFGGVLAVAPMMVQFAEMARPYSMAWSLAIISIYFAVCRTGRVAIWGSAISMGLSIGSRIDMLVLLPIVWGWIWVALPTRRTSFEAVIKHLMITGVTILLVAPWLITNLIGNLRAIASVRIAQATGPVPWSSDLLEFALQQGLGPIALVFVAGLIVAVVSRRLHYPFIWFFTAVLSLILLKPTGYGIRHSAASIIALVAAAPLALSVFTGRPRLVWAVVSVCLVIPVAITVYLIHVDHRNYVEDQATDWVEAHIPSGNIVYVSPTFHDPLPTPQRANELWQELMMNDAAVRKFQSGITHLQVKDLEIPPGLSEENMIFERGLRRKWYILGSRNWIADHRYDIRLYDSSRVFDVVDPWPDFAKTGGVVIWRGLQPSGDVGTPVAMWTNVLGAGIYIYCSPDVRSKITLKP